MDIDNYITLIYKDLKAEISADEKELLNTIYNKSDENKVIYNDIKLTWNLSENGAAISDDQLESDLIKLKTKMHSESPKRFSMWNKALSVAAILLLVSTTGLFLQNQWNNTEISQTADVNRTLTLPDASVVTLSQGSTISYKRNFKGNRTLSLQGLANFQVISDPDFPFIVQSELIEVQVVGTIFTIDASLSNPMVSVMEGIVNVQSASDSIQLTANQRGKFNLTSKRIEKTIGLMRNSNYWMKGQFRFENQSLEELSTELNLIFSKEISIIETEMKTCSISGVFNAKELESLLTLIADKFEMTLSKNSNDQWILANGECK